MSVLPDLKTMPDSALLKLRGQVLDSWADSLEDRRCDPGLALKFRNHIALRKLAAPAIRKMLSGYGAT